MLDLEKLTRIARLNLRVREEHRVPLRALQSIAASFIAARVYSLLDLRQALVIVNGRDEPSHAPLEHRFHAYQTADNIDRILKKLLICVVWKVLSQVFWQAFVEDDRLGGVIAAFLLLYCDLDGLIGAHLFEI